MSYVPTPDTQQTDKKPWYKKWWVILIGALLLVGVINAAINGGTDTEPTAQPTSEPGQTSEPTQTNEPTPEPQEPESDYAADIEAAFLEGMGLDKLTDGLAVNPANPVYYISEWETMYTGTIRVYVQEKITKEEAKQVGIHIFNFVHQDFDDLDTIVVQGTDGIDVNVFRREAPLANQ